MTASLKDAFPPTCEVTIPDPSTPIEQVLNKRLWQLSHSRHPAVIAVPQNEADVVAAIRVAAERGLKVIPAGGSVGSNVVIDGKTLYLDLCRLNGVRVDEVAETVTVGGAAIWREVVAAITPLGFYATWAANLVGVVGSVLGGGLNHFLSRNGFGCDSVVSFRVVTASGVVLDLSESSTGDEARLFRQLRGAGAGLVAVTSLTLRLYRVSALGLGEGDKVVSVAAMFPAATELDFALELAEAARCIPDADPRASVHVALMAAPPMMPPGVAGTPMIMVGGEFLGPREDAERVYSALLTDDVRKRALVVHVDAQPFGRMNDRTDMMFRRDVEGHKDIFNTMLKELPQESLAAAGKSWLKIWDEDGGLGAEEAKKIIVMMAYNLSVRAAMAADPQGRKTAYSRRDRKALIQLLVWGVSEGEKAEAAVRFGKEFIDMTRSADRAAGIDDAAFPNNVRVGTPVAAIYTSEGLATLKEVKEIWDPQGVFWNGALDGKMELYEIF